MKESIALDGISLNMTTNKNVPNPVNIFVSDHESRLDDIVFSITCQCVNKNIKSNYINSIDIMKSRIALIDEKDVNFFKSRQFIPAVDSPIAEYQLASIFKSVMEAESGVIIIMFPEIMLHLRMQHDFIDSVLRLTANKDISLFIFTNAAGIFSKGWCDHVIKL